MNRPATYKAFASTLGQPASFAIGGQVAREGTRPATVVEDGGDYGAGLIPDVVLAKAGKAKGHDHSVDQEFIQQIVALANAKPDGLKCRYQHPQKGGLTLGSAVAVIKNIREEGDMAVGDMHLLASSAKSPVGDLRSYLLLLSSERPDFFGLSIYGIKGGYYFYNADGVRQSIDSQASYSAYLRLAKSTDCPCYITLAALDACDAVDEAALTQGLFAASSQADDFDETSSPTHHSNSALMRKKRLAFDINADTADGIVLRISTNEPTAKEGDEVFAITDDGTETPAPDGDHSIGDGSLAGAVVTTKDGKVVSVTVPEAEPTGDSEGNGGKAVEAGKGQSGQEVAMSAGEKLILDKFTSLEQRMKSLEASPLAQHTAQGGADSFQGAARESGEKLASFEVFAKEREAEAKKNPFPKLPQY